jgi:hypothetical protein
MPTADAVVETERAARYLEQLCRHTDQLRRLPGHRPGRHGGDHVVPTVRQVEWSGSRGSITVDGAQCTLRADGGSLTLHLEASDVETLRRVQALLGRRLETIGRRDDLTVTWTAPDGEGGEAAAAVAGGARSHHPGGRKRTVLLVAAGVGLVLAAHVAIGDAVLTESAGLRWTAVVVVAAILVKVGVVVLGRRVGGARTWHGR